MMDLPERFPMFFPTEREHCSALELFVSFVLEIGVLWAVLMYALFAYIIVLHFI